MITPMMTVSELYLYTKEYTVHNSFSNAIDCKAINSVKEGGHLYHCAINNKTFEGES